MSTKALVQLKELKARADAGDVAAKFELKRTVAAIQTQIAAQRRAKKRETQLVGLVQSGALDHLLLPAADDDGSEEAIGWNPKSIEEGTYDELEQANDLMRSEPTADDLSHKARLKSLKHEALNQQAPFVRANPPSVLNGTLGQQVKCWTGSGLASDQLPQQQAALWQGDDAETTGVAVTVSPVLVPGARDFLSPIIPALIRPYAIIRWGTRGMSVACQVDVGAGCQFTITASNVSVQVALEDSVGPIGSLDMAGMLSFSPVFRTPTPITRTRYVPGSLAGIAAVVPVALFAKRFTVTKQSALAVGVAMVDSQGAIKGSFTIAAGAIMEPMTIGGDVVAIYLAEAGGGAYSAMDCIFELSL